jgi:hypothetical protein
MSFEGFNPLYNMARSIATKYRKMSPGPFRMTTHKHSCLATLQSSNFPVSVPCNFVLLPKLKVAVKRSNSDNEGNEMKIIMMKLKQNPKE